jgi:hypothetical protein
MARVWSARGGALGIDANKNERRADDLTGAP